MSRSCAAFSSFSASCLMRQHQFGGPETPGRFMRASFPKRKTSCAVVIAVLATDDHAARIKSHAISLASVLRYLRVKCFSFSLALLHQPTAVSLSCVPV